MPFRLPRAVHYRFAPRLLTDSTPRRAKLYKRVDESPLFYLEKKQRWALQPGLPLAKLNKWHKYRIVCRLRPRFTVAFSDNLDLLRQREWHYCTVELLEILPHNLRDKSLRKWLVAHFRQTALEVEQVVIGQEDAPAELLDDTLLEDSQLFSGREDDFEEEEYIDGLDAPSGPIFNNRDNAHEQIQEKNPNTLVSTSTPPSNVAIGSSSNFSNFRNKTLGVSSLHGVPNESSNERTGDYFDILRGRSSKRNRLRKLLRMTSYSAEVAGSKSGAAQFLSNGGQINVPEGKYLQDGESNVDDPTKIEGPLGSNPNSHLFDPHVSRSILALRRLAFYESVGGKSWRYYFVLDTILAVVLLNSVLLGIWHLPRSETETHPVDISQTLGTVYKHVLDSFSANCLDGLVGSNSQERDTNSKVDGCILPDGKQSSFDSTQAGNIPDLFFTIAANILFFVLLSQGAGLGLTRTDIKAEHLDILERKSNSRILA